MKIIERHKDELHTICEKYQIKELYAFGSILTKAFHQDSDIDFLVKFAEVDALNYFDNYMDCKEAMEKLFCRNIDLVEVQTIKNPIFKQAINRNNKIVYGRTDSEMAL